MFRIENTKKVHMSKVIAIMLMIILASFYAMPAQGSYAAVEGCEHDCSLEGCVISSDVYFCDHECGVDCEEGCIHFCPEQNCQMIPGTSCDHDCKASKCGAYGDDEGKEELPPPPAGGDKDGYLYKVGGSATVVCPNADCKATFKGNKLAGPLHLYFDPTSKGLVYFELTCSACHAVSVWEAGSNGGAVHGNSSTWNNIQTDKCKLTSVTPPAPGVKPVVTIVALGATKAYDGNPLTNPNWDNTALQAGDYIDYVKIEGSQTLPGSSLNVPSQAVIKNAAGEIVTSKYNIKYANGTLTVTTTAAMLTITANSNDQVYDGNALVDAGFTTSDPLPAGVTRVEAVVKGSQTNVGTSANVITGYTLWNEEEDVTAYFKNVVKIPGVLEVFPREITITANSDTKVFDNIALENDGYEITAGSLADGDEIAEIVIEGSQLYVGSSANVASGAVIANETGNVTDNYKITYIDGTLTVTAPELPFVPAVVIIDTPTTTTTTTTGGLISGAGPIVIDPPMATISSAPTPLAVPASITTINPPLASSASWALLNLILTIVTGLIMIALMITYFTKRKEDEEQEGKEEKVKKYLALRLVTIAATVIAIILFVLTQNMALPMIFIDQWTILHVIITAATLMLAALSMKKYEEEEVAGQEV